MENKYNLEKGLPSREKIREIVEEKININELARISPKPQKIATMTLFIGAKKEEYNFKEEIDEDIRYLGEIKNRVEEKNAEESEVQQIGRQLPENYDKEEIYQEFTDKIMEIIRKRSLEVPLSGMKDDEDIRIGTKTIREIKFLNIEEVDKSKTMSEYKLGEKQ